jgi:hypothetical protein
MTNAPLSNRYPTAEEVADLLGVPVVRLDAVRNALAEAPVTASVPPARSAGFEEGVPTHAWREPEVKDAARRRALERTEGLIDEIVARVERTLLERMQAAATATAEVERMAQEQLQAAAEAARQLQRALEGLTSLLPVPAGETMETPRKTTFDWSKYFEGKVGGSTEKEPEKETGSGKVFRGYTQKKEK